MPSRVALVGVGADGWAGLPARLQQLVLGADVLVGAAAHDVPAAFAQVREPWPVPLREGLVDLLARHEGWSVVGLDRSDPLRSEAGRTLSSLLGRDLHVEPGPSPTDAACARLGWAPDDADVLDLRTGDPRALVRELADGRRLLVLLPEAHGVEVAARVSALLSAHGYGASRVVSLLPLDVLGLELAGPLVSPWSTGLPDASYGAGVGPARDLRAAALARLAPQPGQLLWDLGPGGASVAVEWLRAHRACRALAVEADDAGAGLAAASAARLGVPRLEVLTGPVPLVLAGREAPDAIFVAGATAHAEVLDAAALALRPGGRLVVQSPDGELLEERWSGLGGELTRHAVDRADWVEGRASWTARPPVVQWAWQRG